MDISESLNKLKSILGGRTMKDLIPNVDPQLLPTAANAAASKPSVISAYNVYLNF